MNREDIIRMAREAEPITQFDCTTPWVEDYDLTPHLERFAALVAADEREKEREACAKLCDYLWEYKVAEAHECATAIRKRGDYE